MRSSASPVSKCSEPRHEAFVVASILLLATVAAAPAETYPSRPITMVAPTSAGGPPDTIGRIFSERMRATLGQPVIVENVTGAGGSLGVQRVARAAPDGYTVSIGHLNSHVFTGAVYNLSFDLLKDLAPVTLLTSAPMIFVARSGFPANSVKELIAYMKEHPNGATFGSVGVGGPAKVWATDFQKKLGIEFQFVPYRGASATVQDLIAGQVDLDVRRGVERGGASERRQDQALCRAVGNSLAGRPGNSDHRRGRTAGLPDDVLARPLGARWHAARGHRKLDAAAVDGAGRSDTRGGSR